MNLTILLSLISPILIGYLAIQLLLPVKENTGLWLFNLWKIFLAPAVGFAAISILYYLWSVLLSPTQAITDYISIEIVLLVLLSSIGIISYRRNPRPKQEPGLKRPERARVLNIAATLVFIILLINFLDDWHKGSLATPFGDWDAWAIWNLRAGFITSGDEWVKGFSTVISWSHPDYPLLLPLNVARIWVFLGERSVMVPILLGLIFQISLLGFLITSVQIQRGYLQGVLAGIIGLTVLFTSLGFKLYADIPIAYYFLGANVLLFQDETENKNGKALPILTGLMVAAALWTKNEGWAFLTATILTKLVIDFVFRKPLSISSRWWGYFLIGLAPLLITTIHFKIVYTPPGDLIGNLNISALINDLLSADRYLTIFRFTKEQFLEYGQLTIPMIPLLVVYGIISGISFPRDQKLAISALTLRLAMLIGIYFLIYLITPKDLVWHLSTSIERLVSQVFPSFIFLFFILISSPTRRIRSA